MGSNSMLVAVKEQSYDLGPACELLVWRSVWQLNGLFVSSEVPRMLTGRSSER